MFCPYAVDVKTNDKHVEEGHEQFAVPLLSLSRETTGSAGGGTPQKSFSFKHRAKRAANSKLSGVKDCR